MTIFNLHLRNIKQPGGGMTLKQFDYKNTTMHIARTEPLIRLIRGLDHMIVAVTIILYILYLVFLYLLADYKGLCRSILVPAISFVIVSVFRYFYNAKRPYEVYEFEPLISKKHDGKSFPSRHVFSIFMIAMTLSQDYIYMGIAIFLVILGIALSVMRVLSGVHFIHDVVAGALIGILCGFVGYYLIP